MKLGNSFGYYLVGMITIPACLYFDVPGWVAISYSIIFAAKIIQEGKE